jgi:ParB-like chromosome segregation protein Spo0J
MELVKLKIEDLKPYKNNPRYNEEAVEAVEESIEQVEYITPIVVDENYEILAGHTRHKALFNLGVDEVECIVVRGLTEEQKRKFRLLDNKTAEIAEWDLEKLQQELDGLDFGDFDFFSKEIEKMADKMIDDHKEKKEKVVVCPRCGKVVVGLVDIEE